LVSPSCRTRTPFGNDRGTATLATRSSSAGESSSNSGTRASRLEISPLAVPIARIIARVEAFLALGPQPSPLVLLVEERAAPAGVLVGAHDPEAERPIEVSGGAELAE